MRRLSGLLKTLCCESEGALSVVRSLSPGSSFVLGGGVGALCVRANVCMVHACKNDSMTMRDPTAPCSPIHMCLSHAMLDRHGRMAVHSVCLGYDARNTGPFGPASFGHCKKPHDTNSLLTQRHMRDNSSVT